MAVIKQKHILHSFITYYNQNYHEIVINSYYIILYSKLIQYTKKKYLYGTSGGGARTQRLHDCLKMS